MSERQPRFTLELVLSDNHSIDPPLRMAIGVDDEVRISPRLVADLKSGPALGVSLMSFDQAVTVMKRREFRKDLLISAARRLGAQLAERMEDAEGWHDESRIEPSRKALGGSW